MQFRKPGRSNFLSPYYRDVMRSPSFRGDAQHRARNLEIPDAQLRVGGLVLRTIPDGERAMRYFPTEYGPPFSSARA
jgi:hypothetical protein